MFSMLVLRLGLAMIGLMPWLPSRGLIATVLLFLMAPFMAMIQTVFQAANRRFTTANRVARVSTVVPVHERGRDGRRSVDRPHPQILHIHNSYIFVSGVVIAALCILVSFSWCVARAVAERGRSEEESRRRCAQRQTQNRGNQAQDALPDRQGSVARIGVLETAGAHRPAFGRARVFTYMYLLAPKYWIRTIGPDVAMARCRRSIRS
jgi:hypothetical protein